MSGSTKKHAILYLCPGPMPPEFDEEVSNFYLLSNYVQGYILNPIGERKRDITLPDTLGNFKIVYSYGEFYKKFAPYRFFCGLFFYIVTALKVFYFREKYSVVFSRGGTRTGLAALIIAKITGAKIIVEFIGVPQKGFMFDRSDRGLFSKIKLRASFFLERFVAERADRVKLMYPTQLEHVDYKIKAPISVFHDYIASDFLAELAGQEHASSKIIQFVGFPWYLKGVDVLIKAFNRLSNEYPDFRLQILGYCPDKTEFIRLADGNEQIIFQEPCGHRDCLKTIASCSILVLPSRTEAFGRVLVEAMSAKRVVIAADVDGMPHRIKHGENGLLFKSEDDADLLKQLKRVISNESLYEKLRQGAYKHAQQYCSSRRFGELFQQMLNETLAE